LTSGSYVEPYAGGAGAGLALLFTGEVQHLVINDLDPCVYAFWRAAVDHPDEFAARTAKASLTVAQWKKQKRIYTDADRDDHLNLGFAFFYLNRTNRSGVLNGGPIGGHDQTGPYKIDARFNRDALLERLRLIALYREHITVLNEDGVDVIRRYTRRKTTFVYADPPYFNKAGSLYMNAFYDRDHARLAKLLNAAAGGRWVLTYDEVPEVAELYADRRRQPITLSYSARHVTKGREVVVYSDGLVLPA
jgi:DNA adenine methylase